MVIFKKMVTKNRYGSFILLACIIVLGILFTRMFLFHRSPEAVVDAFITAVQQTNGQQLYELSKDSERNMLKLSPSQLTQVLQALHTEFPRLKQLKMGKPRLILKLRTSDAFFFPILDERGRPLPKLPNQVSLEPEQAGVLITVHHAPGLSQSPYIDVINSLVFVVGRLSRLENRDFEEAKRVVFVDNGINALWNGSLVPLSEVKRRSP